MTVKTIDTILSSINMQKEIYKENKFVNYWNRDVVRKGKIILVQNYLLTITSHWKSRTLSPKLEFGRLMLLLSPWLAHRRRLPFLCEGIYSFLLPFLFVFFSIFWKEMSFCCLWNGFFFPSSRFSLFFVSCSYWSF